MKASKPIMRTYTEALEEKYRFVDNQEVQEFLQANEHVAPLLLEAWARIAENFGPDTSVVLEVRQDPEEDSDPRLFAAIQTKLPPDEARRREARFDEEWWLENLPRARRKVNFCLQYV